MPGTKPPAAKRKKEFPQLYVPDRGAWRAWLAEHHATSAGVWLVYDKQASRADRLRYADAVEEALCFGWIDSTTHPVDDARYAQLYTPRKPRSAWSKLNKERVARLIEQGLMAPAGIAAVETAKVNGAWSALDAVEGLVVPPDLAAALAAAPAAERHFAAFPPSLRQGYLNWIVTAKRPETRERRIQELVELAAAGRRTRRPVAE
jgi:uncharacterized protein YdeI (YjbR/CyaY-like superfamily)